MQTGTQSRRKTHVLGPTLVWYRVIFWSPAVLKLYTKRSIEKIHRDEQPRCTAYMYLIVVDERSTTVTMHVHDIHVQCGTQCVNMCTYGDSYCAGVVMCSARRGCGTWRVKGGVGEGGGGGERRARRSRKRKKEVKADCAALFAAS